MIYKNQIVKRILAVLLCVFFIFFETAPFVMAADTVISGVTPTQQGGKNVYNVDATSISGNTGFRQYDRFELYNGDIVNLLFRKGDKDFSNFVNLVNNQVIINSLVNTMRGNNFFNGHAIFVSPGGVVIGASGVLNVGALSLITPTQSQYNSYLNGVNSDAVSNYVFGSDAYKNLINSSAGEIKVNGKILSRGEVNLYGKNIKVEGQNNSHAGIVSGWNDTNTTFTDYDAAKNIFDSLVNHNITDATKFNLQNGKIVLSANNYSSANINIANSDLVASKKIDIKSNVKYSEQESKDLVKSEIAITNSKISSGDVDIFASAVNEKVINSLSLDSIEFIKNTVVDLFSPNYSITSLWGTSGGAEANVTIANSIIQATNDVNITADAQSKTEQNINLLSPTAILLLKDAIVGKDGSIDTTKRANAKLSEYFSANIFNGFEGPRTSSIVDIKQNTDITAGQDININSYADSSLTATSTLLAQVLPIGIYGVGTSTVSKAIVQDSVLKSTRDTNVGALSFNKNKIVMSSDSLLSVPVEDGAFAILLNNTTKTTTEANLNNTDVNARNLEVGAVNLSDSDVKLAMTAKVDKNVKQRGDTPSSAISLVGILNRSQNNVNAEISNESNVEVTENVDVIAQSLNTVKNSASGKIEDANAVQPTHIFSETKKKLKTFQTTYLNRSLFSRIKGKTEIEATGNSLVKAGGALVWNKTSNNTNAKITNSKINAAGDANVQANTVDLTANSALAESNGKAKVGAGLGVIVNEEHNNTNAIIDKSEIDADDLDVNATTELPMNQGSITFGVKFPFKIFGVDKLQFGGNFASEANGKWDVSKVYPLQDASFSSGVDFTGVADQNITTSVTDAILPKFRLTGFFNNFSQTTSAAEGVDVSASVIYNEVINNTLANIKNNSEINLDGNLNVNAVNSVIGYNAAGMIDILINQLNYKIPGQPDFKYKPQMDSGTFGVGANVIWDIYDNNASAVVENSKITSTDGNVNVTSANEQAYITAIATGGRSQTIGIDGSVNVQKLKGNTYSKILNNSEIIANNINVNAGKAKVETTGGKINLDEVTKKAVLKPEREANDQITNIIATGAWTSQYQEVDNNVQQDSSGGIAIGADVNNTTIERNIKAEVEKSLLTALNETLINSSTYSQTLNLAVAAAFSGGVKQKTDDIAKANNGVNAARNENPNEDLIGDFFNNDDQHMKNPVGNVSNILGQFSLSGAGAVTINHDKTNVESVVSESTIHTGSKLDVKSNKESRIINMSGGLGQSKKVGAGAALNFYRQDGKISSKIDKSENITFSKSNSALNVTADNTNKIVDIAIGAGASADSKAQAEGFKAAVGGSYTSNTITPTIEAIINESVISSENESNKITANVMANSLVSILDIAGGGAYLNGGSLGIGAGFAINYNDIKNTMNALVQNSTLTDIAGLSVTSLARNDLTNVAVAGAIVSGTSSGYLFNGALDVDFIHNIMSSKIVNSDILADGDIDVSATSNTDNLNVAGTLNYSTANTGFGVNGDVIVNSQKNNITAEINNDNTKNISAENVSVKAIANETSSSTPIGAALSAQNTMAAANIALNVISNTVNSLVKGNINTVNNVDVLAFDETTLRSRGITVALTGVDALAVLSGTINYDILNKTVNAKIYDSNIDAKDVNVNASSINSLGGTKNDQGKYDRDDFSDEDYTEKLLATNEKGEYIGLKQDANFTNWNMFYDVASGAHLAFAGAWIIKNIKNEIEAQVSNSVIKSTNLDVVAQDYSIKNILSGAVSASGQVGIGASVLITKDNSNVYALITNGSDLDIEDKLNVNAKNTKDNVQVLAALGGGGTGYAGVNVLKNENTDKTVAKIDKLKMDEPVLPKNPTSAQKAEYNTKKQQWDAAENVKVKANETSINAESNQNSTHVIVAGGGAGTVALAINPAINTYKSETSAGILNATIEDSLIGVNANNNTKTRDIQAGVAGSGVVAGVGLVVINDYADIARAIIDKANIDTERDISVLSNLSLYSLNVLASVGVAIEGVSVVANVVKNHVLNETEASIKDSNILNAGNIKVLANKDKQDKIINVSGGVAVAATGMSATTGNIFNIYKNKTTADVISTAIEQATSLDVEAYSNKVLTNRNVGVSAGVVGAGLLVDILNHELDSTTIALIDAKNKKMFLSDNVNVLADDKTQASNTMVSVYGGAGFAGANVNFFESDNLVKAQILSESEGLISAKNANVNSSSQIAIGNTNVGVSLGIGGIAGDVFGLRLGTRSDKYSTSEEKSNIKKAKDESKKLYDKTVQNGSNYYTPTTSPANLKTGSIASTNANISAAENVNINAKSKLKGIDSEKLSLKNVNTSVGVGAIGVGIKSVKLNNNTLAEVAGGDINAVGDVNLNSEFKNNVEIVNTDINVAGISVAGSSAYYANSSDTTSKIENASISADDVNVISSSDAKADLLGTSVLVSGVSAGISVAEAIDTNKTISLISGNTNIDTSGGININATNNADLSSVLRTTVVSLVAPITYIKNTAEEKSITKAIIENVNGTITTNGLNIIADSDLMRVNSRTNIVSVTGVSFAAIGGAGATMDAELTSGIDSLSGLTLNNLGQTQILSGVKHSDNTQAANINASSQIFSVNSSILGFYTGAEANATNKAKINAKLKANEHNADSLVIKAMQNEVNIANLDSNVATLFGVSNAKINATANGDLKIDIAGNNTIANAANIYVNNTVLNEVSAFSAVAALVPGLKMVLKSLVQNNTYVDIGGNFNSGTLTADIQTNRNTNFDLTSKAGGIASVNNMDLSNDIKGDSILTLSNLVTDSNKKVNNINLSNVSTNKSNTITYQWVGGIIGDGALNYNVKFDTKSKLNVENSDINSLSDVALNVKNNTLIADSAETESAGIVAVSKNIYSQEYNSNAELNVKNSKIKAKNINLKSTANVASTGDKHLTYYGKGGGFIATQKLNVTNNIKENSKINIENSQIRAKEKLNIGVLTESNFKQQTRAKASGFTASPKNSNTLNVENNNTLNISENSILFSDSKVDINLDANNILVARAEAKAEQFGFKDPQAESYLTVTINNEINNNGIIEAGDIVDVDFMTNSTNNLTQYAHSEAQAGIPTTTELGQLTKKINNKFNINNKSSVISGNDIDFTYSSGKGTTNSEVSYLSVCRILFNIPISSQGKKSNISNTRTDSLKLDGEVIAGKGNDKYMKINRDGSVDSSTVGFYDSEYTIKNNGVINIDKMKENNVASITIDLQNTNDNLTEVNNTLTTLDGTILSLQQEYNANKEITDYIEGLQNSGYTFKTVSEVNTVIKNELKNTITSAGISESAFNTLFTAYSNKVAEVEAINSQIYNGGAGEYVDIPTITEFLNENSYGLTDTQKTTVINAMNSQKSLLRNSDKGNFTIYNNQYILTNQIVNKDNKTIGTEFSAIIDRQNHLKTEINNDTVTRNVQANLKEDLLARKEKLESDLEKAQNDVLEDDTDKDYSIVFNYLRQSSSNVKLNGIANHQISGSGKFEIASSSFKIDNYSDRSIVFNGIDLSSPASSGLIINGKNMSDFKDKNPAISGIDAYNYINNIPGRKAFTNLSTNGVHYLSIGSSAYNQGVTVTNYYDIYNPFANSNFRPDIKFFDSITSNGIFDIKNASGDIAFEVNSLVANNINLEATQGNVNITLKDNSAVLKLNENDKIFAGNDITLKANEVNLKGTLEAGYKDRALTITDAMLNNLIEDPTTGEKNMINLSSDANNNIKAIYKNNQIYLFDIDQTGGEITITKQDGSDSSGVISGTIKTTNGYPKIIIDNKTSKQLNVGNIKNNQIEGGLYADGITDNATVTEIGYDAAQTEITSTGKLNLKGIIENAKDGNALKLKITAKNGLVINNAVDALDNAINAIVSSNDTSITVNNGVADILGNISTKNGLSITKSGTSALNIASAINNQEGNINITNAGSGIANISGLITNKNGDITISSSGGYKQTGNITNDNGKIQINNKLKGQTDIVGAILNNSGNIIIQSEKGGTNITSDINANNGSIEIFNSDGTFVISDTSNIQAKNNITLRNASYAKKMTINGSISSTDVGKIDISSSNTNGIDILNSVINENGNIVISNSGNTLISDVITTNLGNVTITSNGLTLNDTITTDKGDILVSSTNNYKQDASLINKNGNTTITTSNGTSIINGDILNTVGDIAITTNGTSSEIESTVKTSDGSITITNQKGNLTIADTAPISATNGIKIKNTGNNLNLNSAIKNSGLGEVELSSSNALNIANTVENQTGNILISSKDLTINNNISTGKGTISVSGSNSYSQNADITNQDGNTVINARGTSATINGKVENTKGNIRIITNSTTSNIKSNIKTTDGTIEIENKKGNLLLTNTSSVEATKGVSIKNTGNTLVINSPITNSVAGDIEISSANGLSLTKNIINQSGNIIVSNTAGNLALSGAVTNYVGDIQISNSGDKLNISGNITNTGHINITQNGTGIATIKSLIDNIGAIDITNNSSSKLTISKAISAQNGNINIISNGNSVISTTIETNLGDIVINSKGLTLNSVVAETAGDITIKSTNGYTQNGNVKTDNGKILISSSNGSNTINGDIINTKGNIGIETNSSNTQFNSNIQTSDGKIEIDNKKGNLEFKDAKKIEATKGIIIQNSGSSQKLTINAELTNDDRGVEISSKNGLDIKGSIYNKKGDLSIYNTNGDMTSASEITNLDGEILFANGGGKIDILGNIDNIGDFAITQKGNGIVNIAGLIDNIGNIRIDNQSESNLSISNAITNENGNIVITSNGNSIITSAISNNITDGTGNITITSKGLSVADVSTTKGAITLTSTNGYTQSGDITNGEGNTIISSTNGSNMIIGDITNTKGNIEISTNGSGTNIASNIKTLDGTIEIENKKGNLTLTDTSSVSATDGISIKNTNNAQALNIAGSVSNTNNDVVISSLNGLTISNAISNETGNINISNNSGISTISGAITDNNGNITITNAGTTGISGAIATDIGDITITSNGLTVSDISTNDGEILLTSTNGYSQSGNLTNGEGNTTILSTNGSNVIIGDITNTKGNIEIATNGSGINIASNIKTLDGTIEIENKKGNLTLTNTSSVSATDDISIKNTNNSQTLSIAGIVSNSGTGNVVISSLKGLTISNQITNQNGNTTISNNANNLEITGAITNVLGNTSITNSGKILKITKNINNNGDLIITQNGTGAVTLSGAINNVGNVNIANNSTSNLSISNAITNEDGNIIISSNGNSVITSAIANDTGNITISSKGLSVAPISTTQGTIKLTSSNGYSQSGDIVNLNGNTTISSSNGSNTIIGDITNSKGNINITTNGTTSNIASDIKTSDGAITITNKKGDLTLTDTSNVSATDGISIKNTNNAQALNIAGSVSNTNGDVVISSLNGLTISNAVLNETGNINISNNSGLATISGAITDTNGNIVITNNGNSIITNAISTNVGDITITSNGLTVKDISTTQGAIILTSTNGYSQSGNIINGEGNTTISSTNGSNVIIGGVTNTKGNIKITTTGARTDIASNIKTSDGTIEIENKKGNLTLTDSSSVSATDGVSIRNTNSAQKLTIAGPVSNTNNDVIISSLNGLTISNAISNEIGNIDISNNTGIMTISGDITDNAGNINISNNSNTIISRTIATNTGDISINSYGLNLNNASTNGGNIAITSTNGYTQNGSITNNNGNTTISSTNGSNMIIGDITNANGNILLTTNSKSTSVNAEITNSNGNITIRNKKGTLSLLSDNIITNTNGNISILTTDNSDKLTMAGTVNNTSNGNININTVNGSEINSAINNTQGNIIIENTANGSIKIGSGISNTLGDTTITNSSTKGGIYLTTSGQINNTNGNTNINNVGSQGIDIQGLIKNETQDINITNRNSNIYIGEYESNNDNYITATAGNIIINEINGSVYNGTAKTFNGINRKNHAGNPRYKTMLVAGGDLEINVTDGDIGRTDAKKPGVSTKAETRIADESINVKINGKITAKAENENKTDKRFINLRAKESDLNLYNVVSDGNIVLTAADMTQTGEEDEQGYAPYDSYSVKNAGDIGDYIISGQNVSIVASDDIGEDGKNLTIIQDHLGNPDSRVYLEAYDSIFFDGRSNKVGEKLRIAQARTKGLGQIVLDLEDETTIEQLVFGNTISVKQKGKNLIINDISMYGEHLDDDDSILPISEDSRNAGGKQIIMEAYDAYSEDGGNSNIIIKNADILGLGLKDENGNRLVDVKLVADNVTFESYALSDMTTEPIVFEVRGVSPDDVASVGGTRTNYNYKDGTYLAKNVNINIVTDETNNHGVIFNQLYSDKATITTNITDLTVNKGYIGTYATITNGNGDSLGNNHKVVVNNQTNNLVSADVQLYTKKTGEFTLNMNGSNLIRTNAPIVHYNPRLTVNGYHSENSFTRLTLKENIVQQVNKDIQNRITPQEVSPLKAIPVKLDTSDIITEEINNYTMSDSDNNDLKENRNLSSKEIENIGG